MKLCLVLIVFISTVESHFLKYNELKEQKGKLKKEQSEDMDKNRSEEQNKIISNKYYFANPELTFQKQDNSQGYNFMEKSNILDKIEMQKGLEAGDIGI